MGCRRPILKKETMHLGSNVCKAKMRLTLDSYKSFLIVGLVSFSVVCWQKSIFIRRNLAYCNTLLETPTILHSSSLKKYS